MGVGPLGLEDAGPRRRESSSAPPGMGQPWGITEDRQLQTDPDMLVSSWSLPPSALGSG